MPNTSFSRFSIDIITEGLPRITKPTWKQFKKHGLIQGGAWWHRRIARNKFTPAAARKYHYTRRKTKNIFTGQVRKTKKGRPLAPNGNPLVWSGRSQALGHQRRITVAKDIASVTSPIRQFNIKTPFRADPRMNMRREYLSTTPGDNKKIRRVVEQAIRKKLVKHKKRVVVRGV